MRVLMASLASLALAASAGAAGRPSVTIAANTHVSGGDQLVLLGGTISSRKAGEPVTIEADDCGPLSRRPAYRVRTASDGGWRSNGDTTINTRYRARWRKAVSRTIRVDARPQVILRTNRVGFSVDVLALDFFDGRTAVLQRYDPEARMARRRAREAAPKRERCRARPLVRHVPERRPRQAAGDPPREAGGALLHDGHQPERELLEESQLDSGLRWDEHGSNRLGRRGLAAE